MIARLYLAARLVVFVAAVWIMGVVLWGLLTGSKGIETPHFAVWLLIGGMVAQLLLWLVSKVGRRT